MGRYILFKSEAAAYIPEAAAEEEEDICRISKVPV
jgi:hypothetical protein